MIKPTWIDSYYFGIYCYIRFCGMLLLMWFDHQVYIGVLDFFTYACSFKDIINYTWELNGLSNYIIVFVHS